jgi:hypothetical protein
MPKRPKRSRELWVIEYSSPDSSHESIAAYESRAEAVTAAVAFIGYEAMDELEDIDWDTDEAPKLLKEILQSIKDKKYDDAIVSWLEFQEEYTPADTISIGPSGQVSASPHDFPLEKK